MNTLEAIMYYGTFIFLICFGIIMFFIIGMALEISIPLPPYGSYKRYRVMKVGNRYRIEQKIFFWWDHCPIRTIEGSFYDTGQQMPILAIEKSYVWFDCKEKADDVLRRMKNYVVEVYKGEKLERVFGHNDYADVIINKHRTGSEAMFYGYFWTINVEKMRKVIDGNK